MNIIVTGSDSQISKSLQKINLFKKNNFFFFNKLELNILNYSTLLSAFERIKPNIVINCVAYTDVIVAENNKVQANEINNECLLHLAKISNQFNSLLIHFSTDYVFDGKKNNKYIEIDKTNPLSVYGNTKLLGEKQIINNSYNYLILRVSWLFSDFKKNFVKFVISKLDSGEDFYAVNDLYSIPTSADEIAKFIFFFINKENNHKYSKVYNFVNSGPVVSWFEFANFIKEEYSLFKKVTSKIIPISSINFYNNSIRPEFSALDNNKLINDFNYQIENWQTSIITLISNKFKS